MFQSDAAASFNYDFVQYMTKKDLGSFVGPTWWGSTPLT